jgi:alpha/beta superfamily hydrolase
MRGALFGIALALMVSAIFVLIGHSLAPERAAISLRQARADHKTVLIKRIAYSGEAELPPKGDLERVKYPSPIGNLTAYISPDPGDGKKRPAIIWKFGGYSNGIGATAWEKATPDNDQSASTFRKAGIVTMYPSVRGGNGNPGSVELFYGEVDDLLAALDYLAAQPYVDPNRIYLGGHSTGGTLVLLAAEMTDRFRAVFSFGPVAKVTEHRIRNFTYNSNDEQENRLRSPIYYLSDIRTPTFVIEGDNGNIDSLHELSRYNKSSLVQFIEVQDEDHFSVLAPMNELLAQKILSDASDRSNIKITDAEVRNAIETVRRRARINPPSSLKKATAP